MSCEECGRLLSYMHSKTGRLLCQSCLPLDGPGQLQESKYYKQSDWPDFETQEFTFVDVEEKTDE